MVIAVGGGIDDDLQSLRIGHSGTHSAIKRADIGSGTGRRFASIDIAKFGWIIA